MLSKIGLIVVLAAGFVVMVLTTALCATPLVVELTRLYQPKDAPKVAVAGPNCGLWAERCVQMPDGTWADYPKDWTVADVSGAIALNTGTADLPKGAMLDLASIWPWHIVSEVPAGTAISQSWCSFEDLQGKPVYNPNCPVGTIDRPHEGQYTADDIIAVKASDTDEFAKYEINKTKSTVEFQALSVEFPAGMTDDGIEQAIKNHPSEFVAKHDIWHTVPKKGNQ
jgi:hypothetical protein